LRNSLSIHISPNFHSFRRFYQASATLLAELRHQFDLRLRVGAITLGRRGCVVVDFHVGRYWTIDILTENSPPTPTGAGDFWHAVWIYHREIERLGEPHSAVAATQTVAAAIGLPPDAFRLRVREFPLPRRIKRVACAPR
jgi:sugar/nucleoside kinase (ribokinase family)